MKLKKEAQEAEKEAEERKEAEQWSKFRQLHNRESCDEASFAILREAQRLGYVLDVEPNGIVTATLCGGRVFYLRSNSDIKSFGRHMAAPPDISKRLSDEALSVLQRAKGKGYQVNFSPDKTSVIVSDGDWQASFDSEAEIVKFGRGMR